MRFVTAFAKLGHSGSCEVVILSHNTDQWLLSAEEAAWMSQSSTFYYSESLLKAYSGIERNIMIRSAFFSENMHLYHVLS